MQLYKCEYRYKFDNDYFFMLVYNIHLDNICLQMNFFPRADENSSWVREKKLDESEKLSQLWVLTFPFMFLWT
jgi:hypothetical protein